MIIIVANQIGSSVKCLLFTHIRINSESSLLPDGYTPSSLINSFNWTGSTGNARLRLLQERLVALDELGEGEALLAHYFDVYPRLFPFFNIDNVVAVFKKAPEPCRRRGSGVRYFQTPEVPYPRPMLVAAEDKVHAGM